jgi:hypothetical protein
MGSASPSISNRITPGTSVRFSSRTLLARRRTILSWRASSSKLNAGPSTISARESRNDAASASRKLGVAPSTISSASITRPALSASDASPKVTTVRGSTIRITIGHSTTVSSDIIPVASSAARKLVSSKPGRIRTTSQKTSATETQSSSPRTAIPVNRRAELTAETYR